MDEYDIIIERTEPEEDMIYGKKRKEYDVDTPIEDLRQMHSHVPTTNDIKYNSFFFRSDIISSYVDDVKHTYNIKQKNDECLFNNNYKLYNIDEMSDFLLDNQKCKLRNYNQDELFEMKKKLVKLVPKMLAKMCSGTVNEGYVHQNVDKTIRSLISNKKKVYNDDIVILANVEIENCIYKKNPKFNSLIDSQELDSDIESLIGSDEGSDLEPDLESELESEELPKIKKSILEEDFKSDESGSEYEYEGDDKLHKNYKRMFKEKLKMIVGFIIVSRGKCKLFPNDYILNLICTNMSGVGTILLGLYLYTILQHPIISFAIGDLLYENPDRYILNGDAIIRYYKKKKQSKYTYENKLGITTYEKEFLTNDDLIPTCGLGILELAWGYFNYPGLCSYQKFGFEYDESLFSKQKDTYCAESYDPLPMSVNLADGAGGCYFGLTKEEKINKILNIIVGDDRCTQNKLCSIKDANHKKLLSCLNTLISYQDSYVKNTGVKDYNIDQNDIIHNKLLKRECIDVLITVDLIKSDDEINYNFIKKIINDIENDNVTSEVIMLSNNFQAGKKNKNKKSVKKYNFSKKRSKSKSKNKNKNKNKKSVKKYNFSKKNVKK